MKKQRSSWPIALLVLLMVIAAGIAYYVWQQRRVAGFDAPAPVAEAQPPAAPATPPPAEPTISHPIEAAGPVASAAQLPPAGRADAYVSDALTGLLGRDAVLRFLATDDFVHRFVATVDNLPRDSASARLWPVNPPAERFIVEETGGEIYLAGANAQRYRPFVSLVESIDSAKAVVLYLRLYPLLQNAYEQLGYPGRHFNDRLVEAIDNLLATPQISGPIRLQLTEVKGPVKPTRPWVRYEYADPTLESLSAGQKLLLRMGPDNARRLKAKLVDLRRRVAPGGSPPAR